LRLIELSAFQTAIDEKYPKKEQPQIFRKYAEEWLTIENLITQAIRESRDPDHTFGQGVVYLALHDKDDPVLRPDFLGNFPVNCPQMVVNRSILQGLINYPMRIQILMQNWQHLFSILK